MGRWGVLLALGVVGCVVDVELGRPRDEVSTPDGGSIELDGATVDAGSVDALRLDAARDVEPDSEVDAAPDSAPDRALDVALDSEPDSEAADDGLPDEGLPDEGGFAPGCRGEVAASVAALDGCEAGCAVPLDEIEGCLAACGEPRVASCDHCAPVAAVLSEVCGDGPGCPAWVAAVEAGCAAGCGRVECADCLDGQLGGRICRGGSPSECGATLADAFAGCAEQCLDGGEVAGCAAAAGGVWALCGGGCVEALDGLIAGCRAVAEGGACAACGARREADERACGVLHPAGACAARGVETEAGCAARCAGDVGGACAAEGAVIEAGCGDCGREAAARVAVCRAEGGLDAGGCGRCAVEAAATGAACGFANAGCRATVDDVWGRCLDDCGGAPVEGGCVECGYAAEAALGGCLAGGGALEGCAAAHRAALAECRCGDGRVDAWACVDRAALVAGACVAAGAPCPGEAAAVEAACRWIRGG